MMTINRSVKVVVRETVQPHKVVDTYDALKGKQELFVVVIYVASFFPFETS
jgi:hypothetical protein